jgi:head-tail adaptor
MQTLGAKNAKVRVEVTIDGIQYAAEVSDADVQLGIGWHSEVVATSMLWVERQPTDEMTLTLKATGRTIELTRRDIHAPKVEFCNWCADPHHPDPKSHPDGRVEHR